MENEALSATTEDCNNTEMGGILVSSSVTMRGNTIIGDDIAHADTSYDPVDACYSCSPIIEYNLIAGNRGISGGGIYCEASSPTIAFNTICNNEAGRGGGIFCDELSSPTIMNTIVAGNVFRAGRYSDGWGIYSESDGITFSCSNIYSNDGGEVYGVDYITGVNGNISNDPDFCGMLENEYSLSIDSPCLAGNHPDGASCGQIGVYGWGCYSTYPLIASVEDIPADQGRSVQLAWHRSRHDYSGSGMEITQYEIFRRIDQLPQALFNTVGDEPDDSEEGRDITTYPPGNWDYLFSVESTNTDSYVTEVSTLEDSCRFNDLDPLSDEPAYFSTFFIRASTAEPSLFYDSPVDSGYSVDDIVPTLLNEVIFTYNSNGRRLDWTRSSALDLKCYNIYCDRSDGFSPGPENFMASTTDTFWVDQNGAGYFLENYLVTAVDKSGNESLPIAPSSIVDTEEGITPKAITLHQNIPNPFNPVTTINFDLPDANSRVTITVYNVEGKVVSRLLDKGLESGRHSVTWNGADMSGNTVSSGLYFCKMTAGAFSSTIKMILLR